MRSTTVEEDEKVVEFARRAAKVFSAKPELATFGGTEKGDMLAIRWGIMDRGVVVVKLDDDFEPVNFRDLVVEGVKP